MGIANSAFCFATGSIGLTCCSGRSNRLAVPARLVDWGGSTDLAGWSAALTLHVLLYGTIGMYWLNFSSLSSLPPAPSSFESANTATSSFVYESILEETTLVESTWTLHCCC